LKALHMNFIAFKFLSPHKCTECGSISLVHNMKETFIIHSSFIQGKKV
jgi:hypothetical protein